MSYLLTHWHGRQPLWRAFWINGVLLRAVIFLGFWALGVAAPFTVAMVGCVILVDLMILTWQSIGYIRTAERNLRGLGSILPLWGGMIALVFGVFFVLSQWWALALLTHPYMSNEPYSEVRARFYAAQYDLSVEGGALQFSGSVALGATERMRDLLDAHPELRQITLDSDGGNIFEARGMARLVHERGLTTLVPRACNSACTLIFIAGRQRLLAPDAQLGFHGYALEDAARLPGFDIASEQARDRAFFRTQGVAEEFVDRIHETPSTDIWFPTRSALQAAGVLSEIR